MQYEDNDEYAEEFKIISFLAMTTGCSNIGIPYSGIGKPPILGLLYVGECINAVNETCTLPLTLARVNWLG